MMKKHLLNLLLIASAVLMAAPARALFLDQILKSPSIELPTADGLTSAAHTAEAAMETVVAGQQVVSQTQSTLNNALAAAKAAMSFDFNALLSGSVFPGQLEYTSCSAGKIKVDILEKDSVAEAVDKLFFRYPGNEQKDIDAYNKHRQNFYKDSLIEAFTAARQLKLYMADTVVPTLEKSKKCITGESSDCGIPAPGLDDSGNNEVLYNEAKALESIDNLLDVLQKAVAIKAQLHAVTAIKDIQPAKYDDEDEEMEVNDSADQPQAEPAAETTASLDSPRYASHHTRQIRPLAFAQMMKSAATNTVASASASVSKTASGSQSSTGAAGQLLSSAQTKDIVAAGQPAAAVSAEPVSDAGAGALTAISSIENTLADIRGSAEPGNRVLNAAVAFSEAPESEKFHPYETESVADSLSKLTELEDVETAVTAATEAHNMMFNLKSYRTVAEEYKNAQKKYEEALAALSKSNQCVMNYLGRRYADPDKAWAGGPLGSNIAEFEGRKGISGWAVDSYDTAKAARTSAVGTDDIALANMDTSDTEKYSDYTDIDGNVSRFKADNPDPVFSGSKEEQLAEENRAAMLLSWQLGAEASKDIANNPEKWGQLKEPFPVWNDTKSFYNQYLDGKYANVKAYLEAFSVNDVKALVIASLNGMDKKPAETAKMKGMADLVKKQTAEQSQILQQHTADLTAHDEETSAAVAALQKQREALLKEIDAASAKAKELSDELADNRQNAQDSAINDVAKSVTRYDGFSSHSATDLFEELEKAQGDNHSSLEGHFGLRGSFVYAGAYMSDQRMVEAKVAEKTAENRAAGGLDQLEQKVTAQKKNVTRLQDQLKQLDEQIKKAKLAAQAQVGGINSGAAAKISSVVKQSGEALDKIESDFAAAADANVGALASSVASKLESDYLAANPEGGYSGPTAASLGGSLNLVIEKALGELYEKVDRRIDQARSQLQKMGDDLYKAENHAKVVKIHEDMLKDIQAMALTVNHSPMGIAATVYLYAQLIPAETEAETEAYFVGSPAKERDLKAPMAVPEFKLPPLREAFHFDDVDFQNVKPFDPAREKSEPLSASDFLNFGGEVPAVWKLMLTPHAFVESEFSLKQALNTGCSAVAFFRGGYMPCKVAGGSAVVDVNAQGRYIKGRASGSLPECPYLEMKNGQVYDSLNEINLQFAAADDIPPADCPYSELGTLLDADDNNTVFFRQSTYDAFYQTLKHQQQLTEDVDISDETRQKLAGYSAGPLSNNQIGDFLKYVENEQMARKNLDELKASYEDLMKGLNELFAKFGLESAAEFDLSSEADYQTARGKLEKIKNAKIAEAGQQLGSVAADPADEVLSERVDKYRNIITALNKDREALTQVYAVVVDNNNFDAEVKTAAVDEEVSTRFEKNLDKNYIAKVKIPAAPYCPNY